MKSAALLGFGALLITSSCKKEVAPGFTSSASEVAIGEAVSFTDNEEERKNSSFMWDFGDGNQSWDRNPSHIYSKAGAYTVSQTISLDKNAEKGKSLKASSSTVITVTGPTANFSTTKTSFAKGEPIVFTNTTTFSDKGYAVSYSWNYTSTSGASGYLGSTKTIAETFTDAGVYTVTLRATQGNTESFKSVDLAIGGGTPEASTKALLVGKWNYTSDVVVTSGSTGAGGCAANGTYTNANIPTTAEFKYNGDVVEFFPTGNQTTGNTSSWMLSSDGKLMTYSGTATGGSGYYNVKTISATSLVLEKIIIDPVSVTCGTVKRVYTITFTK